MWGPSRIGLLKDQPCTKPWLDCRQDIRLWKSYNKDHKFQPLTKYVYAHHKTSDSFLRSARFESCAICCDDAGWLATLGVGDMAEHGYFSLFAFHVESCMDGMGEELVMSIVFGSRLLKSRFHPQREY